MANVPALPTTYVTLANAETVNGGVTEWDAASDAAKAVALSHGRAFIDSKYTCSVFDEDDAPSVIQMANPLLAVKYLQGTLYTAPDANVVETSVDAKGVKSSKKFARNSGQSLIDSNPEVTAILSGYCVINMGARSVVVGRA